MLRSVLLAAAAVATGPPGGDNGAYAPGWNGEAKLPPMGWRSWNAYGANIYEQTFYDAIAAITAKNWTVDGEVVSLADVGYASIGIDEGWEGAAWASTTPNTTSTAPQQSTTNSQT